MYRKLLIGLLFASSMAVSSYAEQVYVQIRPPRPVYERRIPPPSREHVWTSGYHEWDGRGYVWRPGAWVVPPRHHAHWVPAHWVRGRGGYYLVQGHWR